MDLIHLLLNYMLLYDNYSSYLFNILLVCAYLESGISST